MPQQLAVIIVDKSGTLKVLNIKEYNESELFKKCGFKKAEGFDKHTEWIVNMDSIKYGISVYAKDNGKAGSENKYDFPPPIDNKLFFGSCAIVGSIIDMSGNKVLKNLTLQLWERIYEKLFGGFENLAVCAVDDEDEEDELKCIPASKKTKVGGYLKDGFVVDDRESNSDNNSEEESDNMDNDNDEDDDEDDDIEEENNMFLENIDSELSEEEYDYGDSNK